MIQNKKDLNDIYKSIHECILNAEKIALVSHKSPDWDTLWSMTAMYSMIKSNFSWKDVDMINLDGIAEKLSFLPGSSIISRQYNKGNYDLCIYLDVWDIKLAWIWQKDDIWTKYLINVDHHIVNALYWDINLVDTHEPSTTSILFRFFEAMDYIIDKDTATALLTWIYTDTWAFIYSAVKPDTFDIAAKLLELWWDLEVISKNFFLSNSCEFVKLFWIVLERLVVNWDWVALSYLTREDIINSWCKYEELDWIVWRLNTLNNIKYVSFFYEKQDIVKCSLRTSREDVDLTSIAKIYSWWWHRKASAFSIEWKIEMSSTWAFQIRWIDNTINKF